MLVLTRKANEEILIGDNIRITLVRIKGNSVRVGIEAPRDVRVVRGELADQDRRTADYEAIETETVFAHPQARIGRHGATRSTTRLPRSIPGDASDKQGSSGESEPRIFLERVRPVSNDRVSKERVSSQRRLRRAPLAEFIAAT